MQPYQFSCPEQSRIYRRLKDLVGPGAAAFYKDACRLMEMNPPLESTTHLVGHLLREIESSLFDVLKPLSQPKVSQSDSNLVKCPECGCKFQHRELSPTRKDQIKAILKAIEISDQDTIAQLWLRSDGLHRYAHRQGLAQPRMLNKEFKDFWIEIQKTWNTVLDQFEAFASVVREKLNELINKSEPNKQDIDFLRHNTPNSHFAIGYFFDNLEFPAWLKRLNTAGFFKNPPGLEIDLEGKNFRCPVWAQSSYLIKVAPHEPKTVLEIAKELFDADSNNIVIYEDLAKAALKMPSEFAVLWVDPAIDWLNKQQTSLSYGLSEVLGNLIAYLGQENQVDAAIDLTRELLAVLPESDSFSLGRPITHLNEYYYDRIIKEYVVSLIEQQPDVVLTLLCDLLNSYLNPSDFSREGQCYEDHLYLWFPNLNNNSVNLRRIDSILVGAIWDITKQIAERDSNQVRNLFQNFQSYRWRIFDRISLHLLRRFPEQLSGSIITRLTDRDRLEWLGLRPAKMEFHYSHEHALLLQEQFANIPVYAQQQIFCWLGEAPTDIMEIEAAKREEYVKYWRRDWLSILHDYLPPHLNQLYNQLVQELGAPICLDSIVTNKENTGLNSPQSEAELSEMIERFKELDSQFMVYFLRGLRKALENHSGEQEVFSWKSVLAFCVWILENCREICDRNSLDYYSEWNMYCDDVVSLIDIGLQAQGSNKIPLIFRRQVWQLLEPLTRDKLVTPGFTPHYQDSNMGSDNASVNTVRGKAMHAVVEYAFWIRQDANVKAEESQNLGTSQFCTLVLLRGTETLSMSLLWVMFLPKWDAPQNFDDMPEVQQLLEWHLNPQQDPASAIRAVYGNWFPPLLYLASDWVLQQIDNIFPEEPALQWLFEAAWEGYLCNHQPDINVFNTLRRKYIYAVAQLSTPNTSSRQQSETVKALSIHLLELFWYRVIDLSESDKLLEDFFAKAPTYAREEFMRHFSRRLLYQNFEVDDKLRQRLQNFLEWRIDQTKDFKAIVKQSSELKYFSWIFASGKLEDQWAIAKLVDVLKLLGTVEQCRGGEQFLKHLESLAPVMPQKTLRCLCLMVNGSEALEWFASYRSNYHRAILRAALESGEEVAKKSARDLINRLLARNLGNYKELLA